MFTAPEILTKTEPLVVQDKPELLTCLRAVRVLSESDDVSARHRRRAARVQRQLQPLVHLALAAGNYEGAPCETPPDVTLKGSKAQTVKLALQEVRATDPESFEGVVAGVLLGEVEAPEISPVTGSSGALAEARARAQLARQQDEAHYRQFVSEPATGEIPMQQFLVAS